MCSRGMCGLVACLLFLPFNELFVAPLCGRLDSRVLGLLNHMFFTLRVIEVQTNSMVSLRSSGRHMLIATAWLEHDIGIP